MEEWLGLKLMKILVIILWKTAAQWYWVNSVIYKNMKPENNRINRFFKSSLPLFLLYINITWNTCWITVVICISVSRFCCMAFILSEFSILSKSSFCLFFSVCISKSFLSEACFNSVGLKIKQYTIYDNSYKQESWKLMKQNSSWLFQSREKF